MKDSKRSFIEQKELTLQKDLSFSNEVFKKSIHPDYVKSNPSSYMNSYTFVIPPLVKYNDPSAFNQTMNQNNSSQNKELKESDIDQNMLNMFSGQKGTGHRQNQQNGKIVQKQIPSLSKHEEMIQKKYKKKSINEEVFDKSIIEDEEKYGQKPYQTRVYFDKSQKLGEGSFNLREQIHQTIPNMESLEQSRIANYSMQKNNHWVIGEPNDQEQLVEGLTESKIKQNNNSSYKNRSFRNINPLSLVGNSLHNSYLPQFIEDDQLSQQNEYIGQNDTKLMLSEVFHQNQVKKGSKKTYSRFSTTKQAKKNHTRIPPNQVRFKQKSIQQITLSLLGHYFGSDSNSLNFSSNKQHPTHENLINQSNQLEQKSDIQTITNRSLPPLNKTSWAQRIQNKSCIWETNTASKKINLSQQNFIHDKSPQEMIANLYKDEKNAKIFIKYLQVQISSNPQDASLCHHYETLSCLLTKLQLIAEKDGRPKNPLEVAKSMLQFYHPKRQQNMDSKQKKFHRPQIIRSNDKIKIDFDPLLTEQKSFLSLKIAALRKCLQQKSKQTELIKLTYDGIVHNYAVSLQNLAKKAQKTQQDIEQPQKSQNQQSLSEQQIKLHNPDKPQNKNHLDLLRSSLEENIIHRKATFGKISSSFRGSATFPDV